MRRAGILATVVLVAALAPAVAGGVAASTSGGDLVRHVSLQLTPDDPGTIRAVVTYRTPDRLASLEVQPGTGSVVSTNGFSKSGDSLSWDGDTAKPSFTLSIEANESLATSRRVREDLTAAVGNPASSEEGYAFVDAGSWAIVPVPQFSSRWTWYGNDVTLSSETTVDGEGFVGKSMAYLGPEKTYTAEGVDQTFSLVVPDAADLEVSPDQILASLTEASRRLQVGARDRNVSIVAAPTSVTWGPAGLEYGGSDAWVLADSEVNASGNVWLHEYVHTRQDYAPTKATRWTVEATAEYYASLLTLEEGRIDFDAFAAHIRRGTRSPYASAVLADPSTWSLANYVKGPLVYGNVDRAIRDATDGNRTGADVLGKMNVDADGSVTQSEFLSIVANAGSDDTASYADHYTTTRDAPDMWSLRTHRDVFEGPAPRLVASVQTDGVHVTGPYRNTSTGSVPTLVPGETLSVTANVTNEGDAAGTFTAAVLDQGSALSSTSREVAAGGRATVSVSHTFDATGTYTLAVGYDTRDVRVVAPATPNVTVDVNRTTAAPGDGVAVTITASNPADRPARETYPVTASGKSVDSWTASLGPGANASHTTTLTFDTAGPHTIGVGERSYTVEVREQTNGDGTGTNGTAGSTTGATPGFGVPAALTALVAAILLTRR